MLPRRTLKRSRGCKPVHEEAQGGEEKAKGAAALWTATPGFIVSKV